jgi:P27 family predicted phage terminase small subunit
MGKRGPKPKSAAEKRATGNPGKRPIQREIVGPKGRPRRPAWLLPEAADKWEELIPLLEEMGTLSVIDGSQLALYCTCWARWMEAERMMGQSKMVITPKNIHGKPKAPITNAAFVVACKMLDKLNQIGMQFGLSPAARDRLNLQAEEPVEATSEFFVVG